MITKAVVELLHGHLYTLYLAVWGSWRGPPLSKNQSKLSPYCKRTLRNDNGMNDPHLTSLMATPTQIKDLQNYCSAL